MLIIIRQFLLKKYINNVIIDVKFIGEIEYERKYFLITLLLLIGFSLPILFSKA
jgi:hypothetical protein